VSTAVSATGFVASSPIDRPSDPVAFYEEVADDFVPWSSAGNMHFGYCADGMDILDREPQLARMNLEVGRRLALNPDADVRIVDLGCGNGATCRQLLKHNPGWHAVGLNIAPKQIDTARKLAREAGLNNRVTFLCENYTRTSFPTGRFDGALAIESSCYGQGLNKNDFLREAKRLLHPGARLVVADAFFHDGRALPPLIDTCHQQICENWAFDTLAQKPAVEKALRELGFVDIRFEDISINVLPSTLHIPRVTGRFILSLLAQPGLATPLRRGHALAPLFAMMLALARNRLGYYLLSATRG